MLTRWLALPLGVRVALTVWAILLAAVLGRVVVSSPRSQTVIPIYLNAGQRWLDAADLYSPADGLDVYRNPPVVAAGFSAVVSLPEKLTGILWRGFGAAVFLVGLWRFQRTIISDLSAGQVGWWFGLAALVALPAVNNGQVNLLLAGAALNGAAAAAQEKWWEAAAWFGLAGWLKLYPFAFGLLAAVVAPRQLGWKLLAVALLGFAIPFALQEPGYVLSEYHGFFDYLGADDRTYADLQRVPLDWTVLSRTWAGWVVSPELAKVVSLTAAMGAALAVGVAALGPDRRPALGLSIALGSVWMTAFGPATEANTYVVLAAASAHLCVGAKGWARVPAWSGYGLLTATVLRGLFPADWRLQVLGPQPLAALLLVPAAIGTWMTMPLALPGRRTAVVWAARITGRGRPVPTIPATTPTPSGGKTSPVRNDERPIEVNS